MRRRDCLLAAALALATLASLSLTGCGSRAGAPAAAPDLGGGTVVWNEQSEPEPLPDVSFPENKSGETEFPNFNPRDVSDVDVSGYVDGGDGYAHLDSRVFGNLQANGGAGVIGGRTIMVGLNDFADTFGADGWVLDELATESASMSAIYVNDKYPGATLTLDEGFFDDSGEGLATRIETTGFRGYSLDFGKTGHDARPDMHWMGGVSFGASIEEVSGIYLPVCEQEYYSYDGDDYSIRSYQLSENYCVWFGFYEGEGLQFVSLRVW